MILVVLMIAKSTTSHQRGATFPRGLTRRSTTRLNVGFNTKVPDSRALSSFLNYTCNCRKTDPRIQPLILILNLNSFLVLSGKSFRRIDNTAGRTVCQLPEIHLPGFISLSPSNGRAFAADQCATSVRPQLASCKSFDEEQHYVDRATLIAQYPRICS